MSNDFGSEEKLLVIQFLGVLHTWIQETRVKREEDLAVLQIQESLVKLLFARVSRPELYSKPEFDEAGELIFGEEDQDWMEVFSREKDTLASTGVEFSDPPLTPDGDVIDFFTRQKRETPTEEEDEK